MHTIEQVPPFQRLKTAVDVERNALAIAAFE